MAFEYMKRRVLLAALVLVILSGITIALNVGLLDPLLENDEKKATLVIVEADSIPEDAQIINPTNSEINRVEPIKRGLRDAESGDDPGSRRLSGDAVDKVQATISDLPTTEGGEVLIKYNGTIYRMYLIYPA